MTPIPSTRKSLKTRMPKLALLNGSHLRDNITGVLFTETIQAAQDVVDYGLSNGIPTHVCVVHAGPPGAFAVDMGEKEALEAVIDLQVQAKQQGAKVHSSHNLLAYEKALLNGEGVDWTCLAGYKYFFVTAKGKFWLCSMQRWPSKELLPSEMVKSGFPRVLGPGYSRRLSPDGSSSARPDHGTVVRIRPCSVARRWCHASASYRSAGLIYGPWQ
jgi:hypothetical protein